jgi:hypothetical protein
MDVERSAENREPEYPQHWGYLERRVLLAVTAIRLLAVMPHDDEIARFTGLSQNEVLALRLAVEDATVG